MPATVYNGIIRLGSACLLALPPKRGPATRCEISALFRSLRALKRLHVREPKLGANAGCGYKVTVANARNYASF